MKKFALISLGLPPSQSGQSMVLYHLLKNTDPKGYCLITLKNIHLYGHLGNCSTALKAPTYFIQPEYQIVRGLVRCACVLHLSFIFNFLLSLRVYQFKKILKKEKCDAVVVCTGELFDPPAAFLASQSLGLPFFFYIFDYYSRQWTYPIQRAFAENFERIMIEKSSGIIVPNECMNQEYRTRYGIASTVIHNPVDLAEYESCITADATTHDNKNIIYTGAIYVAHYSAFKNLLFALNLLKRPDIKLHIYTPQSSIRLSMNDISGAVIIHKHQPAHMIPDIQRNAGFLFLPLAFNSPFPDVIKTSAPGKIGEYLASKRPILVHAPKNSFISWYFKKHQCGLVVDDNDPTKLAQGIEHLLADTKLQKKLADNAYVRAEVDFSVENAYRIFSEVICKTKPE
jgi:glycosyltransferase involved in cell wall biosynthesis